MAFGAFVRLDGPVEGLIHISELSNRRIQHPKDVVKEGDVVPVKLVRIEKDRHRLGLSPAARRAPMQKPWASGSTATARSSTTRKMSGCSSTCPRGTPPRRGPARSPAPRTRPSSRHAIRPTPGTNPSRPLRMPSPRPLRNAETGLDLADGGEVQAEDAIAHAQQSDTSGDIAATVEEEATAEDDESRPADQEASEAPSSAGAEEPTGESAPDDASGTSPEDGTTEEDATTGGA
ncbi:MAG: S1 RNA-binding domain-containing protein [Dehalococcoidia bacterium]|nr:S1 RNA-binding domain-containing protein [Dehalococcoidia bacterium]